MLFSNKIRYVAVFLAKLIYSTLFCTSYNQFSAALDATPERYRHRDVEEEEDDDGDHEENEGGQLIDRVTLRKVKHKISHPSI